MDKIYPQLPLQRIASNRSYNKVNEAPSTNSFKNYLQDSLSKQANESTLKISKHASDRIEQRGIELDASTWNKIGSKVSEAKKKGIDETLVLVKNAALIVSAKNETVITAMDRQEAGTQIFSNINGAIILD
ncbi:TIGR02530 family flagellar biosynthesis protein [Heyndrickxia ginsengihumi]|uniref:TIGR02530 family flagellar biosynthesis protein n=1 Tax=Heyndrickxia ginsengihumi TaxID=363870 RepID=UPI0004718CF4|nr:TIGR02530 family flagellar biosynthesis protein [Heyndrickxia ginsengihumi]MCM3022498.1 flagellar operon protein [Heyndrickxia ginsengihumi]